MRTDRYRSDYSAAWTAFVGRWEYLWASFGRWAPRLARRQQLVERAQGRSAA